MKNLVISYVLGALAFVCPFAGLHRFYLNKPISGAFYLLTWGFLGIGTVIDLIRMPELVDNANRKLMPSGGKTYLLDVKGTWFTTPEREILKTVKMHGGVVTVQMIAMNTALSLKEAKAELERLALEDYCTVDIDEDGVEIYRFHGLSAKKPLLS